MKTTWRREVVPLAVISAMFIAAAYSWSRVPERLPVHWNAAGEADGYGGKFVGLMMLPLVTLGMYGLFFVLPLVDPGRRNYENFRRAYLAIRTALVMFFGVLYAAGLYAAYGHAMNMTTVIMPATGALFIVLGNVMGKIRPNYFVGIRTPWTLTSKQSWNKTHRLAGWLFMLQGACLVVVGFFSPTWLLPAVLGSLGLTLAIVLPYSYYVYAHDPERISPAGVSPATDEAIAEDMPSDLGD